MTWRQVLSLALSVAFSQAWPAILYRPEFIQQLYTLKILFWAKTKHLIHKTRNCFYCIWNLSSSIMHFTFISDSVFLIILLCFYIHYHMTSYFRSDAASRQQLSQRSVFTHMETLNTSMEEFRDKWNLRIWALFNK